ncbi:translation protein SH3-like domain-containing protein [Stachybotrys elegans]|uniref:Translation protein SH3-like domain-containing protein n=1 Tax=Stachybotrys elegans TaxID=80388 RepID=A0A8K0WXG6_9HYPO|nr:translation protein SH3-like domain-containing protein [Stachybotrys elegans]
MNVANLGRPLGCLKTALRQARSLRAAQRPLSTAVARPSTSSGDFFSTRQRERQERLSKFQVYPKVESARAACPDPMPTIIKTEISKLDPTGARTRLFSKKHSDSAKVGDVLMVTPKTGEPFAGVLLQIRRSGVETAIQLRGQLMKLGVEMWYKIYSPSVVGIDIIWRRPKRARRARLTYMRKPKHDMGSVENMVLAWKKERYALRKKRAGNAKQRK